MNIEEIKTQLDELTNKVNSFITTQGEYVFTKEQIFEFVKKLHEGFMESARANIKGNFEVSEDNIELSLDYNQISMDIDNRAIIDNILDCVDDSDLDEESVIDTVKVIYAEIKS